MRSTASPGLAPALLFVWSAAAYAQDIPPPADTGTGLQEITVTATRQSESISKVAVSVSAITPEAIEQKGLKNIQDIARFTPGVNFNTQSNQIAIRGISSGAGSGTTGIYLDDTPVQMRELGFSADDSLPGIFDVERVEVLRGPQGTLFGAGSEGGTVRYITVQPSLTKYSGSTRGEFATTQYGGLSYEAGGAFGGPIVEDRLGFRVSAWYRKNGGWIDRVDTFTGNNITEKNSNHSENTSFRGAVTWSPVDGLTVTPSVLYQKRDRNDTDRYFVGISKPTDGVFYNGSPEMRGSDDKFSLPALYIKYDVGNVSLISNTSYFKRDNITGYDGTLYDLSYYQSLLTDGTCTGPTDGCTPHPELYPLLTPTGINPAVSFYTSPSIVTNNQKNFTEEFRIQSNDPSARFTWVTGIFFQRNKQHSSEELVDTVIDQLFGTLFDNLTIEDYTGWPLYHVNGRVDSYINDTNSVDKQTALFADVTFKLTDQLKLNAGGRYARTEYSFVNYADGSGNFGRSEGSGSTKEHPVTPKAGVSYQMNNENLFYATYSKGFRVGGANAPIPYDPCKADLIQLNLTKAPDSYKSDSVKSFELGAKNSFLDSRLQFASSIYRITWSGIQQQVYLNTCGIQFTGNLGAAESKGFDIQAQFRPVPSLTIDSTLGYTDAYYTQELRPGGPTSKPVVSPGDGIGGLPGIAPWTFAIGAQQGLPLFEGRSYVRLDYEYRSRIDRNVATLNPVDQSYDKALVKPPSTEFVSLRTGMAFDNANVSLFVDNLFNSLSQLTYTHQDRKTLLFQGSTFRPRTIGITATYNFQ